MTAEEKLKELYKKPSTWHGDGYVAKDDMGRVHIACEDIDLIADLVVERMCKVHNDRIDKALRPNS